jgi:hypothetical protein
MYLCPPGGTGWLQFASQYMPAGASAAGYTMVGNPTSTLTLVQLADTIRAVTTLIAGTTLGIGPTTGNYAALIQSNALGPTAPWTVNLIATFNGSVFSQYPGIGVVVANGLTGATTGGPASTGYGVMAYDDENNAPFVFLDEFGIGATRISAVSAANNNISNFIHGTGRLHLRLLNDQVNMHFQASTDGYHYTDVGATACPTGLTAWGFALGTDVANGTVFGMGLIHENSLSAPTQYPVATSTGVTFPTVLGLGTTHSILPGDVVAIHGMTGNTAVNTGAALGTLASGVIVSAVGATSITLGITGNGTGNPGGTVTLLSR